MSIQFPEKFKLPFFTSFAPQYPRFRDSWPWKRGTLPSVTLPSVSKVLSCPPWDPSPWRSVLCPFPLLSPHRRFRQVNGICILPLSSSLLLRVLPQLFSPFNYFIHLILSTTKPERKIKGLPYSRKFLSYGPGVNFFFFSMSQMLSPVSHILTVTHSVLFYEKSR